MNQRVLIVIAVISVIAAIIVTIARDENNPFVVEKVAPKSKTVIMKCGPGKCGAAMMEEVKAKNPDKKVIMKCGSGKCGAAMSGESK